MKCSTGICRFMVILLFFLVSCGSKGPAAGSPEEVLMLLRQYGGTADVLGLYSSSTIREMERYMEASGMDEQSAVNTLSFIPEGAEYSVQGLVIKGDTCSMDLKYLGYGPEKSRGLLVNLTMVKEKDNWRIDRSADFKKLLESQVNSGAENYLNRIR